MPLQRKLKVLVVDDQLTMRSLVRASLQQIGVNDVREFPDGEEALARISMAKPAIWSSPTSTCPSWTGSEFLQRDPREAATSTAFIMLTGRADRSWSSGRPKLGANNYLVKPFTTPMLKQKIERSSGR